MLLKFSRNEQHVVIVFLWTKKINANQNHSEMHPVYATSALQTEQFKFGVRKC